MPTFTKNVKRATHQAKGDLRLLLTFTYHGCPRIPPVGLKPHASTALRRCCEGYIALPILPIPKMAQTRIIIGDLSLFC
jgi:hypothetical protein